MSAQHDAADGGAARGATSVRVDAWRRGDYVISTDPTRLDHAAIHDFLARQSYWARDIPADVVARALANSLCFGLYTAAGAQVGLARVVTDRATVGYLADVYVLPEHRGRGLSKWLMRVIVEHPELQGFRRWSLLTRDAHGLYRQVGFAPLAAPERWMERRAPDVYAKR